jgi:hypothetical protein
VFPKALRKRGHEETKLQLRKISSVFSVLFSEIHFREQENGTGTK